MIVVDPVALGDVACTRASPGTYYDRNGVLQIAPPNTLRVTYDPTDLGKAPYALIEGIASNYISSSEDFGAASWVGYWQKPATTPAYPAPDGSRNATRLSSVDAVESAGRNESGLIALSPVAISGVIVVSIWARCVSGTLPISFGVTDSAQRFDLVLTTRWQRLQYVTPTAMSIAPGDRLLQIHESTAGNPEWEVWGAQAEQAGIASSYIYTNGTPVSRAADFIAPGAGLVYSNAPIDVQTYDAGATYPKDALVYDPAVHNVFQSLIADNVGKALTDTSAWTPRGAINRWAMLDQYNNTQTAVQDEILLVVAPQAIAQGLYVGNVYADEVRISMVDLAEGMVYSEVNSQVVLNSGSSFFNWCFKRIQRQDYYGTMNLLPYANALITVSIRKIGGTAKCGMFAIGPVDNFGPSLLGLSTEGKDYSSTTFNFDGTSSTVLRPYAKRMTCDVTVDNDQIDYVQARLFAIRQKLIIWFGGPYGSTIVAGRYESFKNVISYPTQSQMNLTIGGSV